MVVGPIIYISLIDATIEHGFSGLSLDSFSGVEQTSLQRVLLKHPMALLTLKGWIMHHIHVLESGVFCQHLHMLAIFGNEFT